MNRIATARTMPAPPPAHARDYTRACGRRPSGLREEPGLHAASRREVGAYFAEVAYLEAASVDAFEILADELAAHDAPAGLVAAARRSARDEVRHAEATATLARRFGAEPAVPRVARHAAPRALEEVALENATEGCVRETYGALVATWQARAALDAAVRATMAPIGADETRHAALAWAVARWAEPRLTDASQRRVRAARAAAVAALDAQLLEETAPLLVATAGLPRSAHARAMVAEMTGKLWCA